MILPGETGSRGYTPYFEDMGVSKSWYIFSAEHALEFRTVLEELVII